MSSPPESQTFNGLGLMTDRLLELGVSVWLATAFFFRGDRLPILDEGRLAGFQRVFIPFDQHLAEMAHLASYSYDFVLFGHSPLPAVAGILRGARVPTLIFCPPEGHHALQGVPKSEFVRRLMDLLRRHHPGCVPWAPGLPRATRDVLVDLVDEADREAKLGFLMAHGGRVAAILAVGMMQEGADWPQCARVIDLAPSASDQVRNQRFGRLVRDHPGKAHVHYYSFLPRLVHREEEAQRAELSRLFAHFHASLILENALSPIKVPVRRHADVPDRECGDAPGEPEPRPEDLLGRFPEPMQVTIEEEVGKALVGLASGNPGGLSPEVAGPAIREVLERLGCETVVGEWNLDALRDQIVLIWRRRKHPRLDIDGLIAGGFDKIWSTDALDPLRLFSAGVCGTSTFAELRDVIGRAGRHEAEGWAREFAARYPPGRVPSQSSDDPRERADALRVAHFRMYKKGKKNGVFYPSVETILEEAGHVGILETADFQREAEAWARERAPTYPPGRLPSLANGDDRERFDAQKISNLRRARSGDGTCTFYPSVEAIFAAAGHHGAFDRLDRRGEAERWARDCARRYPPGGLPSEKSGDPRARKDGKKIAHLRSSRRGKGQGVYYPTVSAIFEAEGHHGVFD